MTSQLAEAPLDHTDSLPIKQNTASEDTLRGGEKAGIPYVSVPHIDQDAPPLPVIYLPGDLTTIRESAAALMDVLAKTGSVFRYMESVVTLASKQDQGDVLEILAKERLPSFAEQHARFRRKEWVNGGASVRDLPRAFSSRHAGAILSCKEALNELPRISRLCSFPPISADGKVLSVGYHNEHELLVTSKGEIPEMTTADAVQLLMELLGDWKWSSPADQSRAIAAILAPMLRLGLFLEKSMVMPIFMVEANHSQSGKGMLVKLIGSIYNEPVRLISQRKGGVGSLDEEFNQALLEGRPLISVDNLRGRINSATLESFVTADGKFNIRALRTEGKVDSRGYVIYGTSNAFETTQDLANRLCAIRILRQDDGYRWRLWQEGGIIEHVKANQPLYLGAVTAVLRSWILDGMPSLDCPHSQRDWASGMNWIVQRIFGLPPLTEGHEALLQRVRNPVLGFLRELAIRLHGDERSLRVAEMISEARANGIEVPGLKSGGSPKAEQLHLGASIARLFGDQNILEVEGYTIERSVARERRPDGEGFFDLKVYRFRKTSAAPAAPAATAELD
jgi:hypothetical protein